MSKPSQPTTAGIITDETGERHIPESKRADGSTRRAIKIRPGYRPPEDVELYKNRTAESFRNRFKGGIPGAEGLKDDGDKNAPAAAGSASAAANKNAKRREARKKAAASAATTATTETEAAESELAQTRAAKADTAARAEADAKAPKSGPASESVDPGVDREKKARGLKKKLKQAKELQSKRDGGEVLLPEQIAKVIRISELVRELEALGFDTEGEQKAAEAAESNLD